jgi:transposase InsO family protein
VDFELVVPDGRLLISDQTRPRLMQLIARRVVRPIPRNSLRVSIPSIFPACGSFNGKFRDECLNENWFIDLTDAREKIETWRCDYNQVRPHSALGYLTPAEFAQRSAFKW